MQKQDNIFLTEKKLTAIIFCDPADPISNRKALKYRNIEADKLERFRTFATRFPTSQYINLYGKKNKQYQGRLYINR